MAKQETLTITTLDAAPEPPPSGQTIAIDLPDLNADHVVVEVVYDTATVSYEVGKVEEGLQMKVPVIPDGGEFFVRVIEVAQTEDGEKRTLIAKS